MRVSVITPCWNSAATLKQTIESVQGQTYHDVEHIVCDGGSTDGTLDIIASYGGKVSLVNGPDKGIYDALNKGLQMASGDIVAVLNSEDFYVSNGIIREVVETFNTQKVDAVYGNLLYVNADDTDKVVRYWRSGAFKKDKFMDGWMIPHPTLFIKKSLHDKYGAYREDFDIAGDYEMMLRIFMKNSIPIGYLPKVFAKMRMGGKSNSSIRNRIIANKEDRKAWKVNGLVPHPLTLIFKPLRKIGQFFVLGHNVSKEKSDQPSSVTESFELN